MKRAWLPVAALLVLCVAPAWPHLPQLVRQSNGSPPQPARWNLSGFAVLWRLNPKIGSNIQGSRSAADVIQASFNTWTGAPNATLSVSRGADSSLGRAAFDGTNLICFSCSGDFSGEAETLAVTVTTVADGPGQSDKRGGVSAFAGQILDSDILFNPATQYSTGGASGQDLQTVATHEIGHFFGLDHSAVVRAVMFPFAPAMEQTLSYDDVAGISALYPKASPDVPVGSVSGTVRLNGSPVFGAHVFAQSATASEAFAAFHIRKSPIATLSRPDGTYSISGLPADSYTVIAEPLDGPANNADVQFAEAFGQNAVQTSFTTRWH